MDIHDYISEYQGTAGKVGQDYGAATLCQGKGFLPSFPIGRTLSNSETIKLLIRYNNGVRGRGDSEAPGHPQGRDRDHRGEWGRHPDQVDS